MMKFGYPDFAHYCWAPPEAGSRTQNLEIQKYPGTQIEAGGRVDNYQRYQLPSKAVILVGVGPNEG